MARLKCICGNTMSNTDVPSKNRIHIFKASHIQETLNKLPSLSLFDYETDKIEDNNEYWYCPECERVYIVEKKPNGSILASFCKAENNSTVHPTKLNIIYIISDEEIYDAEEKDFNITLANFVDTIKPNHTYHITSSNDLVYRLKDNLFELVYEKEKNVPSTATNS